MVLAVVGFALVMAPAPAAAPAAALPGIPGGPTHFGHTMVTAGKTGSGRGGSPSSVGCSLSSAQCYTSYNWGGYAVYNSAYVVSKVSGSWTVPTIPNVVGTACPDSQATWDSNAVWIGIDGFVSSTVEQTGTSADCYYGTAEYYAWYEFYPSGSVIVPFTINPGDTINADVLYVSKNATGPQFTTTITDVTTGSTYTSPKTAVPGALRDSAEWIDESPYFEGFLGLTQVGQVKFSSAMATIGGVSHPIGGWPSADVYSLLMVDYNFAYSSTLTYAKSEPSALNTAGNSFTMKWLSHGP
jgi:hypothetical protein